MYRVGTIPMCRPCVLWSCVPTASASSPVCMILTGVWTILVCLFCQLVILWIDVMSFAHFFLRHQGPSGGISLSVRAERSGSGYLTYWFCGVMENVVGCVLHLLYKPFIVEPFSVFDDFSAISNLAWESCLSPFSEFFIMIGRGSE